MKSNQKPVRAVVDTNVLVSALVFGGTPRKVTNLIPDKVIRPVMSEEIMSELRRIITSRFPEHIPGIGRYEKLLRKYAIWVPLGSRVINVSRDIDDNKIIETAVIGKCSYIISGDKDLTVIKKYENIQILTPAEFLKLT
ncbi:MAG TPA: putative toxin-antitoxin system toxin component, PIN family [Candidatus Saccharimonadales bacterium]|nr:putative toxin-antitoxin system toxin component, PIN family [Candidatus Saccharimonadales bacterium]